MGVRTWYVVPVPRFLTGVKLTPSVSSIDGQMMRLLTGR